MCTGSDVDIWLVVGFFGNGGVIEEPQSAARGAEGRRVPGGKPAGAAGGGGDMQAEA